MKPDSNMETDRLLRRLARHSRDVSMSAAGQDGDSPVNRVRENPSNAGHLDADELIAYAENALPVSARNRYTGHLSECDSCRKQVTELVLSSGVAVAPLAHAPAQSLSQTRSWRDWLAVMFAPRVLRYAASVILIVGISAIAFIVFRGGRDAKFTTPQSQDANHTVDAGSNPSASERVETDRDKNENAQTRLREGEEPSKTDTTRDVPNPTSTEAPKDVPVEVQKSGNEQIAATQPSTDVITGGQSGERSAKRDEDRRFGETRQQAPGADTVAKSRARKEADESESNVSTARESASRRTMPDESKNTEGAKLADNKAVAISSAKPAAKKSGRSNSEPSPAAPAQGQATDDRKDKADAGKAEESRSVSGRQFVRRGGAWVDVAYRSQATTNVNRGSDQYRALVADEPGLRAVANQLGGEVIVVWKGRAYRIH